MTPYEVVRQEFSFPFELYPFQVQATDELALYPRCGIWHEPGAGKTATSTHIMLYKMLTGEATRWVLIVPPILTRQWHRWLTSVRRKSTGAPLSAVVYAGLPAKRRKINLNADFIITSYGLMKNDFEILHAAAYGRSPGFLADEAHAIKNIESQTHKCFRTLVEERPIALLTGTPLTTPLDAYAYIRLISPTTYRNKRQFDFIHIKEKDEYDKVVEYDNLELLSTNLNLFSSRVLRRDVVKEVPPITYNTLVYDLDLAHMKLYERIANEQLVEFEDGREINAVTAQALYSALQQVIVNWGHFDDDPTRVPAVLSLIEEVLDELGPSGKLTVVGNFIRTNSFLLEALKGYNAVAIYGDVSPANKQKAIDRFIEDPACRVIILQPRSAGQGIDGLQHVCSDMLVVEAPTVAPPFYQTVARLDREGQTKPINCRIAVANRTVQVRMFKNLLQNDKIINKVQGGYQDLREAIYGN